MPRATTVVAEARDPVQAQIWLDALRQGGIEAATFERGVGAALGGAVTSAFAVYPVIVAEADLGAARSIIAALSGASAIAPLRHRDEVRASQRRALLTVGAVVVGIIVMGLLSRLVAG